MMIKIRPTHKNNAEYCKRYYQKNKDIFHHKYLMRTYGITKEAYDTMMTLQNGVCAICEGRYDDKKKLAIDHCHDTGTIRGLLCNKCNRGLGMFEDDPTLLNKAVEYLT